jgi:hypothetical protein
MPSPPKTHKMVENKGFYSKNSLRETKKQGDSEKKTNFVQDWGAKKLRRM